jgi:predicted dehydrogenase
MSRGKPVRIGVIGAGWAGRWHAQTLVKEVGAEQAVILGVADPSEEARAAFLDGIPWNGAVPKTFPDYRHLLEEPLDGVVVSSPHSHHYSHVSDSLAAGCHVLVDKPMVTSSTDAEALIEQSQAAGRVISVALQGLFSKEFRYARDVVERGDLGNILLVGGTCCQIWLKSLRGSWRTDPTLSGGGNLVDSGSHMLAAMLHVPGQEVAEVFSYVEHHGETVDVAVAATLRFDGGAVGTALVSGAATTDEEGVYIHGSRGAIKLGIWGGRIEHWDDNALVTEPALPASVSIEQNFIDVMRGDAQTLCPPQFGLRLSRVTEAIYESARTHAPVRIGNG